MFVFALAPMYSLIGLKFHPTGIHVNIHVLCVAAVVAKEVK